MIVVIDRVTIWQGDERAMIKVTLIGAGGIGWTRTLVRDIVTVPELRDPEFALTDIDAERLQVVEKVIRNDLAFHELPAAPWSRSSAWRFRRRSQAIRRP